MFVRQLTTSIMAIDTIKHCLYSPAIMMALRMIGQAYEIEHPETCKSFTLKGHDMDEVMSKIISFDVMFCRQVFE